MKVKFFFLVLFFISVKSFSQSSKVNIPFELTDYNNILLKVILNQKDSLKLMLHTAASDFTLTSTATAKLKSIAFSDSVTGIKSWGGTDQSARLSHNNTLSIKDLNFTNLTITENQFSGQGSDGKIGINIFNNKVLEFDFEKKILIFSDKFPKRIKKYQKLKLTSTDDLLFIEASAKIGQDIYPHKFLIHTGYAGAVLFDDLFTAENKLAEILKITKENTLKDSYGNSIKTQKAILPIFTIGHDTLNDVLVGFFSGSLGRQKMSVIGGDVLKRFNIIIDAKREYIYLKKNSLAFTPFKDV